MMSAKYRLPVTFGKNWPTLHAARYLCDSWARPTCKTRERPDCWSVQTLVN